MGGGLRITVLGEVGASLDGACLELGGYRQRAVLAFLIAARGDIVTSDRLVDALWAQTPPPSSLAALHAYISRLRSHFEPRRAARSRSGFIGREGPGYRLRVPADDVDAWRFERDLRSAAALTDPAETAKILREALALWRGPAFAEYAAEPWARPEIGCSSSRCTAHAARRMPSPRCAGPGRPWPKNSVSIPGSRCAPSRSGSWPPTRPWSGCRTGTAGQPAGRSRRFPGSCPRTWRRSLGGRPSSANSIAWFFWRPPTAGHRWAHRTRDAFPDGQLYVDLRGYDPGQPVRPADAAAGFLRALGLGGGC